MQYYLLTGATGLLGGYLLKDLQLANLPLAVIARASQEVSARQRIDEIMVRWEKQAGHSLPRPVVLIGDIQKPDLGLCDRDVRWIGRHCTAVIHNAASLKFSGSDRQKDPWLSNLNGTQHMLELCRQTGIQRFYHVSTAYVCGQRIGRISESETDIGQSPSNDYEASKLAAENAVRNADWLEHYSIFRPSIIAGDSRTGYTSTYHGFYFVLKMGAFLANTVALGEGFTVSELLQMLNLTGHERKNFVPVDWVSGVMAYIIARPDLPDQTYHLTSEHPVTLDNLAQVVQDVIHNSVLTSPVVNKSRTDKVAIANHFRTQMTAYRSYWRDDPEFCNQNTVNAAPHLPCPLVGAEIMKRWCQFAIACNFTEHAHNAVKNTHRSLSENKSLDTHFNNHDVMSAGVNVQVNGPGGGQWRLSWSGNSITDLQPGLSASGVTTLYLNSNSLRRIRSRELTATSAIASGYVLVEGQSKDAANILTQLTQQTQIGNSEHS